MADTTYKTATNLLLNFSDAVGKDEQAVLDAEVRLLGAKERLRRAEDAALLAGRVDGKNERVREAALAELTQDERDAVAVAQVDAMVARASLRTTQAKFDALRSVALLLAREEGNR